MRTTLSMCLLIGTLASAVAQNPAPNGPPKTPPPDVKIRVVAGDWDASPADIEAVCRSASREFLKNFSDAKIDPIVISPSKTSPIAIFGKNKDGERRVQLAVRGRHWAQFAYQFSHELCHVTCNYRDAKNPNLWFEESLCETASIFVIRRMAESWKTAPPYVNWKSYASSLDQYGVDHVRKTPPLGAATPAEWLAKNEKTLRTIDRGACQSVAVHVLLPLLEKTPSHWQAVRSLNQFDGTKELTFTEYLTDWRRRVPAAHREFVDDVAKSFEVKIAE